MILGGPVEMAQDIYPDQRAQLPVQNDQSTRA